jgi:hypothetical protein
MDGLFTFSSGSGRLWKGGVISFLTDLVGELFSVVAPATL